MMPTFSFVVIAYNVGRYIERCIYGLRHQTLNDFETIIVDDASTDDTYARIIKAIDGDDRFTVIRKSMNEGAHLARKTGALRSTGRYVVFVDGDDELSPIFCETMMPLLRARQNDIIRFGRVVLADHLADMETAYANERMFNVSMTLPENGILPAMFSDEAPTRITWSIIDCVFRGDFVRRCFAMMTDKHLGRTQDSYQMFVLCALAESMSFVTDFRGLRYHLGTGVSGRSRESVERFAGMQSAVKGNLEAVLGFIAEHGERPVEVACGQWLHGEYLRIVGNEWVTRLAHQDQGEGIRVIVRTWGAADALAALLDPLTARAQWLCDQTGVASRDDELYLWLPLYAELSRQLDDATILGEKREHLQLLLDDLREREQEVLRERQRLERERILREGSIRRKVIDGLLPEGTPRRELLNAVVKYIRHR